MEKQITSYLISLTHFIHPPGVASTARYCVLIDKMCLIIYCCGMAAHIWWTTRVSSLRFSCSGCARTLCFNWSNKCSIGVYAHCLLQSLLVCFQLRGMMRNPVPTSYHDLHGYEEEELTSFRYLIAVMFPWMVTLGVFVCMKTLAPILLCLFSPYLMFS